MAKIDPLVHALGEVTRTLDEMFGDQRLSEARDVAGMYRNLADQYRRAIEADRYRMEQQLSDQWAQEIVQSSSSMVERARAGDYEGALQQSHDVLQIMAADPSLPGDPGSIPSVPPNLPWPKKRR